MKNKPKTHNLKIVLPPALVVLLLSMFLCFNSRVFLSPWLIWGWICQAVGYAIFPIIIGYAIYRFAVSREKDDLPKLWITFGVVFVFMLLLHLIQK
ncbi:MAG: hypothetical protein ACLSS9_10935 [Acutalibacteraceae bacterium]